LNGSSENLSRDDRGDALRFSGSTSTAARIARDAGRPEIAARLAAP
jgi:acyl-CoA reductase-like NAD-dependent aldehyde dehydrogenase